MFKRMLPVCLVLVAGGRATAEWIEVPLTELAGEYYYGTHHLTQLELPYQADSLVSAWIHARGSATPGLAAGDGIEVPWDVTVVMHPQIEAFFPPAAPCCILAFSEELDGGFDVVVPFHRYFQAPFDFLLEGPAVLRLEMGGPPSWYGVVESPYLLLEEVSVIAEVFPNLPPLEVGIQAIGSGILLSWDDALHREWAIHRLAQPGDLPTDDNRIATVTQTRFFDEYALQRGMGFYVVCPSFDPPLN